MIAQNANSIEGNVHEIIKEPHDSVDDTNFHHDFLRPREMELQLSLIRSILEANIDIVIPHPLAPAPRQNSLPVRILQQ